MNYEDNNKENQENTPERIMNIETGLFRTLEAKLFGFWTCAVTTGILAPITVYELFEGKYKTALGLALFDACAIIQTKFFKDEITEKYMRR